MEASPPHKIRVEVDTSYLAEQSDPRERRYVFSYTITIHNENSMPARLMTRHWIITDSNGKMQKVHGESMVGEQPHLKPGQRFRYSSGAVLETPVGVRETGEPALVLAEQKGALGRRRLHGHPGTERGGGHRSTKR